MLRYWISSAQHGGGFCVSMVCLPPGPYDIKLRVLAPAFRTYQTPCKIQQNALIETFFPPQISNREPEVLGVIGQVALV